jgi:hypothetical protein
MPKARDKPWKGRKHFLHVLDQVEASFEAKKPPDGYRLEAYRGWSTCRICGERNGNKEYTTKKWIWPEGLMHYIQDHNLKPSDAFIDYILRENGEIPWPREFNVVL